MPWSLVKTMDMLLDELSLMSIMAANKVLRSRTSVCGSGRKSRGPQWFPALCTLLSQTFLDTKSVYVPMRTAADSDFLTWRGASVSTFEVDIICIVVAHQMLASAPAVKLVEW